MLARICSILVKAMMAVGVDEEEEDDEDGN